MKPPSDRALRALQNGLLRAASFMVPAGQRSDWRREWHAELWHVRHSLCEAGALSWPAQQEINSFCLGSLHDALCLRRERRAARGPRGPVFVRGVDARGPRGRVFVRGVDARGPRGRVFVRGVDAREPAAHLSGAAGQCILRLGTLLVVCVVLANLLPGVESERDPSRFQVNPGVILIQTSPSTDQFSSSIPVNQFFDWKNARQRFFDEFAFYRTVRETASLPSRRAGLTVTHASLNLFSLLGLQVPFVPSADDGALPAIILSHRSWVRDFASDSGVAGRVIRVGARLGRIAGVMPIGIWRLPDEPDAWLLESDSQLAAGMAPGALGHLLAHLTPRGQDWMQSPSVPITLRAINDDTLSLYGVSFADRLRGPRGLFQFALILAILALPAVTSVTLGESNYSSHRPSRTRTLIRWAFLASKFLFVAAIAYFASLDLAYWNASNYSSWAECGQLAWAFSICLFGFRWALSDQRQRCPVCLRRVTHPAQVGLASRTFLGWNGTEMICMGGHTLLHVPSLPTSWFSGQRWLYLDTSWEFLFADPVAW